MSENKAVEVTEEQTVFTMVEQVKAAVQEVQEDYATFGINSYVSTLTVMQGIKKLCDVLLTGGDVAALLKEYGVGRLTIAVPESPAELVEADGQE